MILGFTGSRLGLTEFQRQEVKHILDLYKPSELAHGDCIGSDAEANIIAYDWGVKSFSIFPGNITKKRAYCFDPLGHYPVWEWINVPSEQTIRVRWTAPVSPLERNHTLVKYCDMLVACPQEQKRSGTWATIRLGWRKRISDKKFRVIIIPPLAR